MYKFLHITIQLESYYNTQSHHYLLHSKYLINKYLFWAICVYPTSEYTSIQFQILPLYSPSPQINSKPNLPYLLSNIPQYHNLYFFFFHNKHSKDGHLNCPNTNKSYSLIFHVSQTEGEKYLEKDSKLFAAFNHLKKKGHVEEQNI